MKKAILRTGVIIVWSCMLLWLLRYEAFPEYFTGTLPGYGRLLSGDVLITDNWMRILLGDTPIGYSYTRLKLNENDPGARHEILNDLHLKLGLMGKTHYVRAGTSVVLDVMYDLQKFRFDMKSGDYLVRIEARRSGDDTFETTTGTPHGTSSATVRIPDDVVVYSPMTELAMRNLAPGESIVIKTLDPVSFATTPVTIQAVRREPIQLGTNRHDSMLMTCEYRGVLLPLWIDDHGRILRQTTPFGWTLEKCTSSEALASVRGTGAAQDILARMSVPCRGTIPAPRKAVFARMRLRGGTLDAGNMVSNRQAATGTGDGDIELTVTAAVLPSSGPGIPEDGSTAAYLRPERFIQSDHPEIVRRARKITAGRTNAIEKASAIMNWVDGNVANETEISLPSALDVLQIRKGDCNEHTYLSVALARAAGIPARIHVGLAYHAGSFYYHAWPAVYLGDWVEMDPTWGQETVDATHIALAQGGLENQFDLVKVMGNLSIDILETR